MATTPNPATTEWVPLWDLNGIALSTVPPHRVTHETGGADAITSLSGTVITTGTIADARLSINVLKYTGGYPGGTTTFLRADGTFSTPPATGLPGLHATTHSPGGSDPLQNNAWLNTPNIFTKDQTLVGPAIGLILTDTSQPANLRGFSIRSTGQALVIQPVDDNNSSVNGFVKIDRNSTILAPNGLSSTPLDASNLTSGTVPAARLTNVAILNVPNIFSQPQRIIGIKPSWEVQHSGNAVISRIGQVVATNRFDIASNIWYDGANWNCDDISQPSVLYIQQIGEHNFYTAAAGPNPRSGALIQQMRITASGTIIPAGLGTTPLNASNITSGTVPDANLSSNVALRTIDNNFYPQTISSYSRISGPNSYFAFNDTGGAIDTKTWRMVQYNDGNFWLEALNDANSIYQARFGFIRDGSFVGLLDAGQLNRGTIPDARYQTQGYFLPIMGGDGGESGQLYNYQQGYYVKTGKIITVWSYTQFKGVSDGGITNAQGTIIGRLVLKNLPYPIGNPAPDPTTHQSMPFMGGTVAYYSNTVTPQDITAMSCRALPGGNRIEMFKMRSQAQNPIPMTGADVNESTQYIITCTYLTT